MTVNFTTSGRTIAASYGLSFFVGDAQDAIQTTAITAIGTPDPRFSRLGDYFLVYTHVEVPGDYGLPTRNINVSLKYATPEILDDAPRYYMNLVWESRYIADGATIEKQAWAISGVQNLWTPISGANVYVEHWFQELTEEEKDTWVDLGISSLNFSHHNRGFSDYLSKSEVLFVSNTDRTTINTSLDNIVYCFCFSEDRFGTPEPIVTYYDRIKENTSRFGSEYSFKKYNGESELIWIDDADIQGLSTIVFGETDTDPEFCSSCDQMSLFYNTPNYYNSLILGQGGKDILVHIDKGGDQDDYEKPALLLVSHDYGDTWNTKDVDNNEGGSDMSLDGLKILHCNRNNYEIYLSLDGGESYVDLNKPATNFYPDRVSISKNGNILYISDGASAYTSIDNGANWNEIAVEDENFWTYGEWWSPIFKDSFDGQYVLAYRKDSENLAISSNFGESWEDLTQLVKTEFGTYSDILEIDVGGSGELMVMAIQDTGIVLSTDYGETWSVVFNEENLPDGISYPEFQSANISEDGTIAIGLAASDSEWNCWFGTYISTDQGETWESVSPIISENPGTYFGDWWSLKSDISGDSNYFLIGYDSGLLYLCRISGGVVYRIKSISGIPFGNINRVSGILKDDLKSISSVDKE